jgi:hypothetical protein
MGRRQPDDLGERAVSLLATSFVVLTGAVTCFFIVVAFGEKPETSVGAWVGCFIVIAAMLWLLREKPARTTSGSAVRCDGRSRSGSKHGGPPAKRRSNRFIRRRWRAFANRRTDCTPGSRRNFLRSEARAINSAKKPSCRGGHAVGRLLLACRQVSGEQFGMPPEEPITRPAIIEQRM